MLIGIGAGIPFIRRRGFSVGDLFANGEAGAWYDPSDFSTMFQDAAGTTPVTAVGQSVGKILDKSGRGNHATQSTLAYRPILRVDSYGNYYLETLGGNCRLVTSAFAMLSGKAIVAVGVQKDINYTTHTGSTGTAVSFGAVSTETGSFDLGFDIANDGVLFYRRGSGSFGAQGSASIGGEARVICATIDLSQTTHATENANLLVDNQHAVAEVYGSADSGSGDLGTHTLVIGGGVASLIGRIYQVIVRAGDFTASDISAVDQYISSKTLDYNGGYGYSDTPTTFDDTSYQTQRTGYIETDPFASVSYSTSATHFRITANGLIQDIFGLWGEIGVLVDGVYVKSAYIPAEGEFTCKITLPAGSKTVKFVNGGVSNPAQTASGFQGTMLVSVEADAAISRVTVTPTNRLAIYGDSISIGANCKSLVKQGWTSLVRDAYYPDSTVVVGAGYRSLYMDANDAPTRAAFVAQIASANPDRLWIAIGTNDYGLNKWNASSFGTAYAALLDDLHTALPALSIYCQTPILRTTETANASGSTLGDYRTEISTAVSTRTAFCTLVDGTAIMTTASLNDGVHPSIAGHVTYANFVKTALGIA